MERAIERLNEIKREHGEEALPLNRAKATRAKWKALAKVSMLKRAGGGDGGGGDGFVPTLPANLGIDASVFCRAFPYHMVLDHTLKVVHAGVKVSDCMLCTLSSSITDLRAVTE